MTPPDGPEERTAQYAEDFADLMADEESLADWADTLNDIVDGDA